MTDRMFIASDKPDLLEVEYGQAKFLVSLVFESRTRLTISVYPDKSVLARAPLGRPVDEVIARITKRAAWIVKQLEYFERFHPLVPPRQYVSGETHYYLGRQYRLRIEEGDKPLVKLVGRFFRMELPDPSNREKAKLLLQKWYSVHARNYLEERVKKYMDHFKKLGAKEPEIKFRKMKKRWGSCSNKSIILLNTELVKSPLYSIDYVVIHELCHLIHPGHGREFYKLLARLLPDWKKRKEVLERYLC